MSAASGTILFPTSSPPAYPGTSLTPALNVAFLATATMFQGAEAPTASGLGVETLAGIWWHSNISPNRVYVRNQADDAWIEAAALNETEGTFFPVKNTRSDSYTSSAVAVDENKDFIVMLTSGFVSLPTFDDWPKRQVEVYNSTSGVVMVSGDAPVAGNASGFPVLPYSRTKFTNVPKVSGWTI